MYGAIILRNLPKHHIQIDLGQVEMKGWYRGFGMVPPGLHYIGVQLEDGLHGFWCWVKPGEAVVRVFDHKAQAFVEDTPESTANFSEMVRAGMMGRSLVPYNMRLYEEWHQLTHHIMPDMLPPVLFTDDIIAGTGTRFDNAFYGSHGSDARSFLTELQFSFLCWRVEDADGAKARWMHLLTALSKAGPDRMALHSLLFVAAIDVLMAQFDALYDGAGASSSLLGTVVMGMIDDMQAAGTRELQAKAADLEAFIRHDTRIAS